MEKQAKNKKKTNTDGTIDFINGSKMFLNDSIYRVFKR